MGSARRLRSLHSITNRVLTSIRQESLITGPSLPAAFSNNDQRDTSLSTSRLQCLWCDPRRRWNFTADVEQAL